MNPLFPSSCCMTMQDELHRSSIHDSSSPVSLASPSFSLPQVIFVSPIPGALNVFTPGPGALAHISARHAMGLACASSCCTPSGAATLWRNQLQQRLRCRKLVHPVNVHHTCGVECPIHGYWGAGYLAWLPGLSSRWWLDSRHAWCDTSGHLDMGEVG